jgi:hypothetical protein
MNAVRDLSARLCILLDHLSQELFMLVRMNPLR